MKHVLHTVLLFLKDHWLSMVHALCMAVARLKRRKQVRKEHNKED